MKLLFRGAMKIAIFMGVAMLVPHCVSANSQSNSVSATPAVRQELNGLEVIRWTTTKDTSKLEGVVVGFQSRPVMKSVSTELLLKEGFLAAIVTQQDMSILREKIGTASMDIRTNYGIMPNWREVFKRNIPEGQALSIGGHARTTTKQVVQIAARGWSTPTESGGCFQLEIATSIVSASAAQEVLLARADRPFGTLIANTGIETCLNANEVLILLCANPGPFKSGRGPGSDAPLPPNAGRFLLGESADLDGQETPIQGVTILAFVPHMPSSIQPAKNQINSTVATPVEYHTEIAPPVQNP